MRYVLLPLTLSQLWLLILRRGWLVAALPLAAAASLTPGAARSEVAAGGLGTRVNGTALGRCEAGVCNVQGGTAAGRNLFHRFSRFDTRSGIERVELDTRGRSHVVVGVSDPAGSFFNAPLRLSDNAHLFWLSPGGLWLGEGASFVRATNLLLTTAASLRLGGQMFDALSDGSNTAQRLGQPPTLSWDSEEGGDGATAALAGGGGPIVLAGGRLRIDRHLLLDSGSGPILTAPGAATTLEAGASVRLMAGGGLRLHQFSARAGGKAAPGLVRLSAGTPSQPAGLSLSQASLAGGEVALQAVGPIALRQVEAVAAAAGGTGRVGMVSLSPAVAAGGEGGLDLNQVRLVGQEIALRAVGDLRATDLRAEASGSSGAGRLWLRSEMGPGSSGGALTLRGGRLQAGDASLQAASSLELQQVELRAETSAGGGELTLVSGSSAGGRRGMARLEGVDLAGQEIRLRGDGLHLVNSRLTARGEQGLIQLQAVGASAGAGAGEAQLDHSQLAGQTIQVAAEAGLLMRGGAAVAGPPGRRGLIQLESALAGGSTGAAETTVLRLEGAELEGRRLVARGGAIKVASGSRMSAPKGIVHLEAKTGDVEVRQSRLTVTGQSEADLRAAVSSAVFVGDVLINIDNLPPSIGLHAAADLRILESELSASQELPPMWSANPALRRSDVRLTDTAGLVIADAGQDLLVERSRIAADASDTLAGNVILRAQAKDGRGALTLRQAEISADGGAGSGDLRLNSAGGIRLIASELRARSFRQAADPGRPAAVSDAHGFSGGEITLTNSAADQGIALLNARLLAEQSQSGPPLLPTRLNGVGLLVDAYDEFDGVNAETGLYPGGLITLISSGGIDLAGPQTLLSVDSQPPGGEPLQGAGGTIRLANLASHRLRIADGARLSAATAPRSAPEGEAGATRAGEMHLWSIGPIEIEAALLGAAPFDVGSARVAAPAGLAVHSAASISLTRSDIERGDRFQWNAAEGVARRDARFWPACGEECAIGDWSPEAFETFVAGEFWGSNRPPNYFLTPDGRRAVDQVVAGGEFYGDGMIADGRRRIDSKQPKLVRLSQGASSVSIDLSSLPAAAGTTPMVVDRQASAAGPAAACGPSSLAAGSCAPLAPLPPWLRETRPRWSSAAARAGKPIAAAAGAPLGGARLPLAEAVVPLSDAAAQAVFLADQRAASAEVAAAFGLAAGRSEPEGVGALQRRLREGVAGSLPLRSAQATAVRERPAILHIGLTPQPNTPYVLLHQILIPAFGDIRGWQSRTRARELKDAIQSYQRQLSQLGDLAATGAARELAALLLGPVLPEVQRQGINALLLSLDRGLQGIPFAALPWREDFLGDLVALTVTPALALTDLAPPVAAGERRALLAGTGSFRNGLAPLPMARRELEQLALLHPEAQLMVDGDFQAKALLKAAKGAPLALLHLATHADGEGAEGHGARLYTNDGELPLRELGRQRRGRTERSIGLFVLNACRTALGDEQQELGMTGLALQAGASSALGNLWYVDDVMTAAFSVQFHRHLQRGLRLDQALQETQRLFRRGEIRVVGDQIIGAGGDPLLSGLSRADQLRLRSDSSHPYFWAGTILSGRPW